jgi:hypothetical protein
MGLLIQPNDPKLSYLIQCAQFNDAKTAIVYSPGDFIARLNHHNLFMGSHPQKPGAFGKNENSC